MCSIKHYKPFNVDFLCNNRELLDTHENTQNIRIPNYYFLGLFDAHESFITCKCDTM
jgi:hypothetical protein